MPSNRPREIRLEVGIVDEDERDRATQIDALEIVPLALRRRHAEADEDERRLVHRHALGGQMSGADRDILSLAQQPAGLAGHDAHGDRSRGIGLGERHVLRPRTAALSIRRSARLQAGSLELLDDVVDGLDLAGCGGRATFEVIRREHLHMLGHARGIHALLRVNRRRQQDECEDKESEHGLPTPFTAQAGRNAPRTACGTRQTYTRDSGHPGAPARRSPPRSRSAR